MNSKALQILEFDKIRAMLSEVAATEGAKKKALCLEPSVDIDVVRRNLKMTSEAKKLAGLKGLPIFGRVVDIRETVERAEKSATLSAAELLNVAELLRSARSLLDYVKGERTFRVSIEDIFERLIVNRYLEDKIFKSIISEDTISDEASPELSDIRRKMRNVNNKINDVLQNFVSKGSMSKYLQENIVTTRGGRYVVPVKSEYKNEVKGLVHDVSASGATFFIEPTAIVEANNELRTLESMEKREIERILSALSAECASFSNDLILNYLNITELAFVFAKADLSYKLEASEPIVTEKREMSLVKARHPLLDVKKVVPITISLGKDFSLLVITGPNTGGKTVSLKTIGLFSIMAQAGLHIPCEEGSVVCVFDEVFSDIGDEQSIEQSLSTFSAHMVGIVKIIEKMTDDSLVLFDELGAGTDPVEGAALAMSILEEVRSVGALCAATTHYAELKAYAIETEGVSNASCEFNVETLKPTYRLIIGAPGKSNAFAISEKLGLPEYIVKRAEGYVDSGNRNFEAIIEKLNEERFMLSEERRKATEARIAAEEKLKRVEKDSECELRQARKEAEDARKKAKALLVSAKAAGDFVMAELEEVKKQRNSKDFEKNLSDAKRAVKARFRSAEDEFDPVDEDKYDDYVLPRPLVKGDSVIHKKLKTSGVLLADPDKKGNVEVQMGIIKSRVNVSDLVLDEKSKVSVGKSSTKAFTASIKSSFNATIDVRGMIGEDAWFTVDKYFDDALIASVKSVTVLHGKGTGALRTQLWNKFKNDKRIKSFRAGQYGEGDYGVTIVDLK